MTSLGLVSMELISLSLTVREQIIKKTNKFVIV
jgi:hypothetical protein